MARVVSVAAGLEETARAVPVRDGRHEALSVLIGNWVNSARTVARDGVPAVPSLTGDVYECCGR